MLSVIRGIIAASAMAALLLLRCVSLNQVAGGSSSETVIGKVANEDGTPACSIPLWRDRARIRPMPLAHIA
jgi:hypothetical protein